MATNLVEVPRLDANSIPVIFLVQFPENITEQLKASLSSQDADWIDRPLIDPPNLSFFLWPRSAEGTNANLYRIAAQAQDNNQSSLIFIDGKWTSDGSVLITRMLDGGKLGIRRVPSKRATIGLKDCEQRAVSVDEAQVGRFVSGFLQPYLVDPYQVPFRVGGNSKREGENDSDPRKFSSVPEEIEFNPDRPVVISLTAKIRLENVLPDSDGKEAEGLSATDVEFYPWSGPFEGTRADLSRLFQGTKFVYSKHTGLSPSTSRPLSQLFLIGDPTAEKDCSLLYAQPQSLVENIRVFRIPTEKLGQAWSHICGLVNDFKLLNRNDHEYIVDPDGYMYGKDQPLWSSNDLLGGGPLPPTFYLFKPSQEDDKSIRKELETFSEIEDGLLKSGDMDEVKTYAYVPWEKDEDGTELDMVRIAKETGLSQIIFIDRQTIADNSVILSDAHLEYDKDEHGRTLYDSAHSHHLGLSWGRSPGKEARLSWINLDIANMDLEEVIDGGDPQFSSFELLGKASDDGKDGER